MRRAFTLIELLVVIAIIAILAAILFPVFAQAKEAAKKTVCVSNTKQIALGVYMYTSDFDDIYPQTSWESSATPQPFNTGKFQIHWTNQIQPYVRNWNIFVCPSDPAPVPTDAPCPNGIQDIGQLNGSGQMYCDWAAQKNSYIPVYNAMPAHDWTVVSGTSYAEPASQIIVTEHRNDLIAADGHKGLSGFWPSQPCGNVGGVSLPSPSSATTGAGSNGYAYFTEAFLNQAYANAKLAGAPGSSAYGKWFKAYDLIRVSWDRHTGGQGANYSFADGHAKYEKLGQTVDNNHYQYGDRWYPTPQAWGSCP